MNVLTVILFTLQMLTNASWPCSDLSIEDQAKKILGNSTYHIDENGIVIIDETGGRN